MVSAAAAIASGEGLSDEARGLASRRHRRRRRPLSAVDEDAVAGDEVLAEDAVIADCHGHDRWLLGMGE
jgi:hypothetical protein